MKNKKGVSMMIAYLLIIVMSMAILGIYLVYVENFMPKNDLKCPDGVSMLATDSICTKNPDGSYNLEFEFKNNGFFDVDGYYIRGSLQKERQLATYELSDFFINNSKVKENIVSLKNLSGHSILTPGVRVIQEFKKIPDKIYFIQVMPVESVIIDKDEEKNLICSKAIFKEIVNCDREESGCTDTCESLGYNCGEVCGVSCGECFVYQTCIEGKCKNK